MVIGFVVGTANNIVDKSRLGLIAGGTIQAAHTKGLMANAVMIGVDLGPNLSVPGSLATILWLLAIRKESGEGSGDEKVDVGYGNDSRSCRARHKHESLPGVPKIGTRAINGSMSESRQRPQAFLQRCFGAPMTTASIAPQ